jgi:hypothetical protein
VKLNDVQKERLVRTGLINVIFQQPEDVVKGHLAMQSQDFSPAKWSIAQRLSGVVDADVERKVSQGSILRTHVLRPTWHFVARTDLRWLMALTGPRVQKAVEPRYGQLGLDTKTRSLAEKVISTVLRGGNHLTRKDLSEALRRSRLDPDGQRLPHLLMHCELESVICSGRVGKNTTYALFDERVPTGRSLDRDRAVVELVRRYLTSHGPATLKDMAWWSGLKVTDLKAGLEAVSGETRNRQIEGITLWWIGEPRTSRTRTTVVQLLQAYDEFVVGYTESRYLGDPRAARVRAAFTERGRPNGTIMLGSHVAGHWRRSTTTETVDVQVQLYEPLRGAAERALERAVQELGTFLGRRADVTTGVL